MIDPFFIKLLIIVGIGVLIFLFGRFIVRDSPTRWGWLLIISVPALITGYALPETAELWGGGLVIFGLLGSGLGILGLTHINRRQS